MKCCSKISVVFISLIILLSSTGILFVHHHCGQFNTNEWHLFSSIYNKSEILKADCCSCNESEDCSGLVLTDIKQEKSCCSFDGLFYKIGLFDFNVTSSKLFSFINVYLNLSNHSLLKKIKSNSVFICSNSSPPYFLKQIFLINCILII